MIPLVPAGLSDMFGLFVIIGIYALLGIGRMVFVTVWKPTNNIIIGFNITYEYMTTLK